MKKELIEDIIDFEFLNAFNEAGEQVQIKVNDILNITYQEIRERLSNEYHNVMNRPQEVGVKEFLEHLVSELYENADLSRKRLYRTGYYDAVKVIEKIIKSHGENL